MGRCCDKSCRGTCHRNSLERIEANISKIITIFNFFIIMKSIEITHGRHSMYLSLDQIQGSLYWGYISVYFWSSSLTCTKISILLMLLRIKQTPTWKRGVFTFIAFLILNEISIILVALLQCKPIEANWNLSVSRSGCLSMDAVMLSNYVNSSESDQYCRSPALIYARFLYPHGYIMRPPTSYLYLQDQQAYA
jgi:hypothetical protein